MTAPSVQRVFFDVGGTMLRVEPSVGHVYSSAAQRHGVSCDPEALDRRFVDAWRESLVRARDRDYACSDDILRAEWRAIVAETFRGDLPAASLDAVFAELYELFVSADVWRVKPGVVDSLRELRDRGIALGVLSNWDRRLVRTLEQLGLAEFFDLFVVSHEVGCEKPHPDIFEVAARRAGRSPSELLLVGDSLAHDIRPANALGWRTLWVTADSASNAHGPAASTLAEFDWDGLLRSR